MSSPPSVCLEFEEVDEECVEASMMFLVPGSENRYSSGMVLVGSSKRHEEQILKP